MAPQNRKGDHALRELVTYQSEGSEHAGTETGGKCDRIDDAIDERVTGNREDWRNRFAGELRRLALGEHGLNDIVQKQAAKESHRQPYGRGPRQGEGFRHDVQERHRGQHTSSGKAEQIGVAQAPITAQRNRQQAQRRHEGGDQAKKEWRLEGFKHSEYLWR